MNPTVVIIEDDRDILELVCEVLEAEGYRTVTFPSPDITRIIASVEEPALFLIDLMLPGSTGVEVAKCLRASAFPHAPMIAMSASRLMLEVAGSSAMFDELVAKPFNLSTLLQYVDHFAGQRHVAPVTTEPAAS